MKNKWVVAALIVGAGIVVFGAPLPEAWKYDQTVAIGTNGLIKIDVPLETLDHARPGLEDLRLYDAQGAETPFLIERPVQVPAVVQAARNMRVTLRPEATVVVVETGLAQALDGVILESPARAFIKSTLLEGSQDGKNWLTLADGEPIFRQSPGASKLHLPVTAAKWAWLRVTLDDKRSPPIPITGARIQAAGPEPAPTQPMALRVTEREDGPGRTRLTLRVAGAPVVLAGITIETPEPLFTRRVSLFRPSVEENEIRETMLAEGTVYRMALEGRPMVSDLTFAQDAVVPVKELVMTIENGDSPPLAITAVRAARRPVLLTFLASGPGVYHLLSGNTDCAAPQYDLAIMPHDVSGRWVPSSAGEPGTNATFRQKAPLPEVAESGAILDTSEWNFRKRVVIGQSGVQQLELDLETLSEAVKDFSDLRLILDGRQVSYLIERPVLSRRFSPIAEKVVDPKRPSISRWRLKLPQQSLAVTRLQGQTEAPFFKRDAVLLEQVPDERGNLYTAQRGAASWVRALNQTKTPMSMDIQGPLSSDTVDLEMENGDNPPLEMGSFEMEYPVVRLIFKATGEGNVYLYYGNSKARRPQYDIDLAARQMLAEVKIKATPGPAEQLRGHRSIERLGGASGWVFWGVLGLVVIGLLVVITRLLPKHLDDK